ncbi:hypothetical protein D9M72_512640 [compost metagenome]
MKSRNKPPTTSVQPPSRSSRPLPGRRRRPRRPLPSLQPSLRPHFRRTPSRRLPKTRAAATPAEKTPAPGRHPSRASQPRRRTLTWGSISLPPSSAKNFPHVPTSWSAQPPPLPNPDPFPRLPAAPSHAVPRPSLPTNRIRTARKPTNTSPPPNRAAGSRSPRLRPCSSSSALGCGSDMPGPRRVTTSANTIRGLPSTTVSPSAWDQSSSQRWKP